MRKLLCQILGTFTDLYCNHVCLLQDTVQRLRIVNPGPIPASFSMSMESRDTPFKVKPLTAELDPNEELDLEVMPSTLSPYCICLPLLLQACTGSLGYCGVGQRCNELTRARWLWQSPSWPDNTGGIGRQKMTDTCTSQHAGLLAAGL